VTSLQHAENTSLPDATRAQLEEILSRLHVLVMGPGLGRENYMQNCFHVALTIARSRAMLVVLDADALWAVGQRPSIIKGYKRAVLTPNIVEFNRLCEGVGVPTDAAEEQKAALLSRALGGVTVLQKGAKDIIAVDNAGQLDVDADRVRRIVEVDSEGGLKRCGGQGDVLGGAVGTMLAWAKNYEDGAFGSVLNLFSVSVIHCVIEIKPFPSLTFPSSPPLEGVWSPVRLVNWRTKSREERS
jgi:ATP-dependent NAD(P)H-hydrate dehydratase